MKKLFILAVIPLLFAIQGCKGSNGVSESDNFTSEDFHEVCLDGVIYLMRQAGNKAYMSVKFNKDSKVVTCKDKNHG